MPRLFSYGTLQDPRVQLVLFGRQVPAQPDALLGYRLDMVTITDPDVLEKSGKSEHPILRPGAEEDSVPGSCLELTDEELAEADRYEVDDYIRVLAPLRSGASAWAYVAAALG